MRAIFVMILFLFGLFFITACTASLHHAVDHSDYASVEELIQKGADINEKRAGWTPLMTASYHGNVKIVEYLIKEGADLDIRAEVEKPHPSMAYVDSGNNLRSDFIGFTALHFAAYYGNTEAAKVLIDNGAKTSMQDEKGYTAYDYARQYEHIKIEHYIEKAKQER